MNVDEDQWLAECLAVLRPGWRGRVVLLQDFDVGDEEDELLVGTVVEGPMMDRDPDTDELVDAAYVIATDQRDGAFVPAGEPAQRVVRVSEILELEEM